SRSARRSGAADPRAERQSAHRPADPAAAAERSAAIAAIRTASPGARRAAPRNPEQAARTATEAAAAKGQEEEVGEKQQTHSAAGLGKSPSRLLDCCAQIHPLILRSVFATSRRMRPSSGPHGSPGDAKHRPEMSCALLTMTVLSLTDQAARPSQLRT